MPRPQKFTDDELRDYLRLFDGDDDKVKKIAALFKVTVAAIHQRMARLERKAAPMAVAVVAQTAASMWDVRTVLETAYKRLDKLTAKLEAMDAEDVAPQLIQAIDGARKLADTAVRTAEAWYRVEETKAFMEDVLATLAEVDPTLRGKVLDRIKRRRSMRAAFVDSI
jgi:uncharacterized coiled-coil protein SlyX